MRAAILAVGSFSMLVSASQSLNSAMVGVSLAETARVVWLSAPKSSSTMRNCAACTYSPLPFVLSSLLQAVVSITSIAQAIDDKIEIFFIVVVN